MSGSQEVAWLLSVDQNRLNLKSAQLIRANARPWATKNFREKETRMEPSQRLCDEGGRWIILIKIAIKENYGV
jgi:hypothetical protein